MKTQPVRPAQVGWGADGRPHSSDFGLAGGHLTLAHSGLPEGWAGRPHFVMLQTGFGLGDHFLASWDAWRRDPARCQVLHYLAITPHPPQHADLVRAAQASAFPDLAQQLVAAWPPASANLHALAFEGGRLRLLLGWGELRTLLPEIQAQVDAFVLAATASEGWQSDTRLAKSLARRAATGATLVGSANTPTLSQALVSAGFEIGPPAVTQAVDQAAHDGSPGVLSARWSPRFTPRGPVRATARAGADAVVVGAGLAGAATARALHALGWRVTLLDRHEAPAQQASSSPAGLFHGTVLPDDGPHARILRAAAQHATRVLRPLIASGAVQGQAEGLLRMGGASDLGAMRALIARQGLPADYVVALAADQASRRAGVALSGPAWFYPGGGWLSPPSLVQAWLDGLTFRGAAQVARLQPHAGGWQLLDKAGGLLAQAPVVVMANADGAPELLAPLGHAPWPLQRSRGQISLWRGASSPLALPLAGEGYALPLPDGLLCGATTAAFDGQAQARASDHEFNWQRLARLCGLAPPPGVHIGAWVGWRVQADDRLPIVGPLPLPALPPGSRRDQARLLPRTPGLFVCSALGARGITLAPLMGELLAAQISHTPLPLEQSLVDAVDPGRWQVRAARQGTALAAAGP